MWFQSKVIFLIVNNHYFPTWTVTESSPEQYIPRSTNPSWRQTWVRETRWNGNFTCFTLHPRPIYSRNTGTREQSRLEENPDRFWISKGRWMDVVGVAWSGANFHLVTNSIDPADQAMPSKSSMDEACLSCLVEVGDKHNYRVLWGSRKLPEKSFFHVRQLFGWSRGLPWFVDG